ncbi:DMT family transporter [Lacisediminimonas sp.]|uniref:DMT family transporter n=1 Tax=Lacisediminimonas sp. TaxID=3060582 RepID=UPI00271BD810|nr:DMT family transporter [Lacisediminimonas sp.]MDO8299034.1 DMT family transporter [Lacisediminimonas sp.]
MALVFAVMSSLCFGIAMIVSRVGLRFIDARAGAATSIPTATVLFLLASPFAFDTSGFTWRAAFIFAAIGVFFPAVVTMIIFRSNELLGPTTTSSISGTAPLFALIAAGLLLGEKIPPQAALSAIGVVIGVVLLTWKPRAQRADFDIWSLSWPIAGAVVRGVAQAVIKAALMVWPHAFSATVIGYVMSSATVIGMDRLRPGGKPKVNLKGVTWFMMVGVLNGSAVLLMYLALNLAPVWQVAPIFASYPLITALIGALVLHDEKLSLRTGAGACITVAAVVYLFIAPVL